MTTDACALRLQVLAQALPRFIGSTILVLKSPSGAAYTFTVSGREVINIGPGDQHATLGTCLDSGERRLPVNVVGDAWSVMLWPTREVRLFASHHSTMSALLLTHIGRCCRS